MSKRKDKPISERQLDRLGDILDQFHGENAMNLEQLDGFFAALHCEPTMTPPSRYLPEIWGGGKMSDEDAFDNEESFQEFVNLTIALWNDVGRRFEHEFFMPMFFKDEADNIAHGNNWTIGFMRGVDIHINDWLQLMHDEEKGGILLPIMALAHEHDPDPELRSYKEPVSPEQRTKLLAGVVAGATLIYKYFAPQRIAYAKSQRQQSTVRHEQPKTGRNDPCPCGSGLKYKKCCGKTVLH